MLKKSVNAGSSIAARTDHREAAGPRMGCRVIVEPRKGCGERSQAEEGPQRARLGHAAENKEGPSGRVGGGSAENKKEPGNL